MKKVMIVILALSLLLSLCACGSGTETTTPNIENTEANSTPNVTDPSPEATTPEETILTESEGLSFVLSNDGASYEVAGRGSCEDAVLVIPSEYSGMPVTGIVERAFYECYPLQKVIIPNSVTTIGDRAFNDCPNLISVTISESVTKIGELAFPNEALEDITVAEGNSVYHSVDNCVIETATKTLVVGCDTSIIPTDGSVTSIGCGAFAGCEFDTFVVPDVITSIGEMAFTYCPNLTAITIPDSVEFIDDCAFRGCRSLASIVIPEKVTTLENQMFEDCDSLIRIFLPNGIKDISTSYLGHCRNLRDINYNGTIEQWNAVNICNEFDGVTIHCTDGDITT